VVSTPHLRAERAVELAERIGWGFFAPLEFCVTVLIGMLLYLGGALYFAAAIYLKALCGLLRRARALAVQRFRAGRVCADGKMAALSLSEIAAARRTGEQRRHAASWLN